LRERRELLQLGIGAVAGHGHANGRGGGEQKLHFVPVKFAQLRRVDTEHAERMVLRGMATLMPLTTP